MTCMVNSCIHNVHHDNCIRNCFYQFSNRGITCTKKVSTDTILLNCYNEASNLPQFPSIESSINVKNLTYVNNSGIIPF